MITLAPLGHLRADFRQKFGTPRQGSLAPHSRGWLELETKWRGRGILSGLEGFSHVWLITFLHLSDNTRVRGKVHPPRLRGAKIGVLASRSPHRPNNIGLTLARIVSVEGDVLRLTEIDIVDGTPILDVKPYLAQADRPAEFRDGWAGALSPLPECATEFSPEAERELTRLAEDPGRTRALITEMLALDPRPPAYLNREDARFAVWVGDLNVVLKFSGGCFRVVTIEKVSGDGPGLPARPRGVTPEPDGTRALPRNSLDR